MSLFRLPPFRADLRCKCGRWTVFFGETKEELQGKLAACDWSAVDIESSTGRVAGKELRCGGCQ